ncbi:DUF6090 family protein [Ascidiimonas aurantiaca]|uniref:DUF6090 family protein n=1 Tax=Ascidiimonas aurantiaca TaxID=1685432 RepID=UPI0030ECC4BD
MLKFFKEIRRKLLLEKRFSKYLVYALGEITLVVIGILLALQFNNLNEQSKINKDQTGYLRLLRHEMANNLTALQIEREDLGTVVHKLRSFIMLMDRSKEEVSEKELAVALSDIFNKNFQFKYENGALTELIATGGLKNIANDRIRNLLASWESRVQKVINQEQVVNRYIQKGNEVLEKKGSFRSIIDHTNENEQWQIAKLPEPVSNLFILESQEFENILIIAIGTGEHLYKTVYPGLEKDLELLIDLIDNELP